MRMKSFLSKSAVILAVATFTVGVSNTGVVLAATSVPTSTVRQKEIKINLSSTDDLKNDGILTADEFIQAVAKTLKVSISDKKVFETPLSISFKDQHFTQIASLHSKSADGKDQVFNIVSLTLPEKLQTIDKGAFKNFTNLTGTLVIPASVTSIGQEAFAGTQVVPDFSKNKTVNIGEHAFPKPEKEEEKTQDEKKPSQNSTSSDQKWTKEQQNPPRRVLTREVPIENLESSSSDAQNSNDPQTVTSQEENADQQTTQQNPNVSTYAGELTDEDLTEMGFHKDSQGRIVDDEGNIVADSLEALEELIKKAQAAEENDSEVSSGTNSSTPASSSSSATNDNLADSYNDDDYDGTNNTTKSSLPKTGEEQGLSLATIGAFLIAAALSLPIIRKVRNR